MKSKKMKIIIFIIAIIVFGIIAMVIIPKIQNEQSRKEEQEKVLSKEEFEQYITPVQITTENWKDFFVLEDYIQENKDAFGELTDTFKGTTISFKDDNMFGIVDFKFASISNSTKTQTFHLSQRGKQSFYMNIAYIDGSDNYYDTRVDINKLNCVQIKATVYKADIPEEVWKTNANGKQVIDVNMGNYTTTYEKDNYIDWLQNEENLKTDT